MIGLTSEISDEVSFGRRDHHLNLCNNGPLLSTAVYLSGIGVQSETCVGDMAGALQCVNPENYSNFRVVATAKHHLNHLGIDKALVTVSNNHSAVFTVCSINSVLGGTVPLHLLCYLIF